MMGRARQLLNGDSTSAIILGACDWRRSGLGEAPSFERSADDVYKYLTSEAGLGIERGHILNYFNSDKSASDQIEVLRDDLSKIARSSTGGNACIDDILVYYIGHGICDDAGHLTLLVRRSARGLESETGIKATDLARVLKIAAPQQRRLVILDCCFSESAARSFLGMAADMSQAVGAIAARDLRSELPKRGTMLLCSSPIGEVSYGPPDARRTLFTGAVMEVLSNGDERKANFLSFADLRDAAYDAMLQSFGPNAPRPALHQTTTAAGDLTRVAAFPNPRNGTSSSSVFGEKITANNQNNGDGVSVNSRNIVQYIVSGLSIVSFVAFVAVVSYPHIRFALRAPTAGVERNQTDWATPSTPPSAPALPVDSTSPDTPGTSPSAGPPAPGAAQPAEGAPTIGQPAPAPPQNNRSAPPASGLQRIPGLDVRIGDQIPSGWYTTCGGAVFDTCYASNVIYYRARPYRVTLTYGSVTDLVGTYTVSAIELTTCAVVVPVSFSSIPYCEGRILPRDGCEQMLRDARRLFSASVGRDLVVPAPSQIRGVSESSRRFRLIEEVASALPFKDHVIRNRTVLYETLEIRDQTSDLDAYRPCFARFSVGL